MKNFKILMEQKQNYYQDFQWAFGPNHFSLDLMGVWPNGLWNENDKDTRRNFKYLRIPFILLTMSIGMLIPQILAIPLVYNILPLVTDNVMSSLLTLTSVIKIFLLWINRRVYWPVLNDVMLDWQSSHSEKEYTIMLKQARRARFFTIGGYAIMCICVTSFLTSPLFGLKVRIINNITDPGGEQRHMPVQSYYPFEFTRSPYFELLYIIQLIAGVLLGISFSTPDYFFGALVFHASGQCEILGIKIRELLPLNFNFEKTVRLESMEKQSFQMRLKQLVKTHVHLIRFVSAIERTFNLLILTQTICLTVIIVCVGFRAIQSFTNKNKEEQSLFQVITLGTTVLDFMIHMFIYCVASETLVQHSVEFSDAIYCSGWYLIPPKIYRDVILIMVRAQFPLQLSAGKFFYLSLSAYLTILKSTFGYISMLLAVS